MKKVYLLIAAGLIFMKGTIFAQALNWTWAKRIGGINNESGSSVAIDAIGNIYTTGYFSGTVDFDPGPGTFNLTSNGSDDVFVCKMNASGNLVWAKAMGGALQEFSYAIALDASGNVYTTGYFQGTADFDPGSATYNIVSGGGLNTFISKLDNSGNFVWAKAFNGLNDNIAHGLALDHSGAVYTTGYFQGTVDFNPGTGTFNMSAIGSDDVFISKLDSMGNFLWAKAMNGTSFDFSSGQSITTDVQGNVYSTGYFNGTYDFNPNPSVTFNLVSVGNSNIFISKLTSSGNFIWAVAMGGAGNDNANSISLDPSGNIYTIGHYYGAADFDPGPGTFNLPGTGTMFSDVFISKLTNSGNFLWAKTFGGIGPDEGNHITSDGTGNVYATGSFYGTVDFDPGTATNNLTSAGIFDVFVFELDPSGNLMWAKSAGGLNSDIGDGLAVDASSTVYLTGEFESPVLLFGSDSLINADNSGNTRDFLIAKLSCATSGYASISSCNSYISPSGQYVWTVSGIYNDTLLNSSGCDSIIEINLSISTVDTSVTQNGITLTANASGAIYHWLDCNNNFAIIPGATNQGFTPSVNGDYAVAIAQNSCADTSSCYGVTGIGITEIDNRNNFKLFPNPATNVISITLNRPYVDAELTISEITGKVFFTSVIPSANQIKLDTRNLGDGIYVVRIQTSNFIETEKLIVER